MEVRVLVRELSHHRSITPLERRWAEASYVGLVGGDLDLLQWLVDRCGESGSIDSIQTCLARYGEFRGWHALPDRLFEGVQWSNGKPWAWESGRGDTDRRPPPGALELWALGVVEKDRYEGTSVHSALLALHGQVHVIEHRLWRGQARELLPVLDALRLEICEFLSLRYPEWSNYDYGANEQGVRSETRWGAGGARLNEYPAIVAFVDGLRRRHRDLERLFRAVQVLRDSRNELAHYKALSREQFEQLWGAIETARIEARQP